MGKEKTVSQTAAQARALAGTLAFYFIFAGLNGKSHICRDEMSFTIPYRHMKKLVFTLMLMLVTALAVHAQNLTGKQWCTVLNDEDGEGIAVALTFENNGSCEMLIAAQQEMEEEGVPITLMAGVTVPGTYKRNGNDLNTRFNNGKAKVDVDYEIQGMDAETKALLDKEIKTEIKDLKKEFRQVLLGGMPKMDHLKIVSIDGNRLVVKNDDDQEIPFYAE